MDNNKFASPANVHLANSVSCPSVALVTTLTLVTVGPSVAIESNW